MSFEVIFLHGPAAAGKHTIGSQLAELTGLPLFHNHLTVDLVTTLFEFGSAGFVQLRADIWRAAYRAAAEAQQSFIFTFNPEATVDPQLIQELEELVSAGGGQLLYVELLCDLETLAGRMDNASRAQFGKLTDPALFRQLVADGGFDFPPLPEAWLTVDTALATAEEAAQAIHSAWLQR